MTKAFRSALDVTGMMVKDSLTNSFGVTAFLCNRCGKRVEFSTDRKSTDMDNAASVLLHTMAKEHLCIACTMAKYPNFFVQNDSD